jgi:copper chaperone
VAESASSPWAILAVAPFGPSLAYTPHPYRVKAEVRIREAKVSRSVYTVDGMTCGHCVDAVTRAISSLATVTQVDVDLASGRIRVVSSEPLDDDVVRTAVAEAGYQVVS